MQTAIAMALSLALGAGTALAQSAPPPTTGAIGKEDPKAAAAKKTADGIAECMKLWDAKTHMTKGEWARTCKRVQMPAREPQDRQLHGAAAQAGRAQEGHGRIALRLWRNGHLRPVLVSCVVPVTGATDTPRGAGR